MIKVLLPLLFSFLFFSVGLSQNVGINTSTPTNSLHVVPIGGSEPFRVEGLTTYQVNDTMLLVTDITSGVIRSISYADIVNILQNRIDTDIDSMRFSNDTLYLYEDNITLKTNIYLDTNLVDSLIYSKFDSAYNYIIDSIQKDSIFISTLDSLLRVYGDTIYFNDTTFSLYRDSLLGDSLFIDSLLTLLDSIDTDIDSVTFANDTIYIYENGTVVSTHIKTSLDTALVDSLILAKADTLYSIISDSLTKDTLWIKQIDSLLSIYGDTIYFNDTSYSLFRDSLLGDSLFIDSLLTLLDSIDTDIDSVTFANDTIYIYENGTVVSTHIKTSLDTALVDSLILAKTDTLYSIISDSLTKDTLWIKQIDSLLSIYGDTIYFNDTSYSLISDSLLNDTSWLNALADSIDTDVDSLVLNGDTSITLYEDGKAIVLDIKPLLDSLNDKEPWRNVSDSTGADNTSTNIFYNNGRVSIGTGISNPLYQFDVLGNSRFQNNLRVNQIIDNTGVVVNGYGSTNGYKIGNFIGLSGTHAAQSTILGNSIFAGTTNSSVQHTSGNTGSFVRLNHSYGISFHTGITTPISTDFNEISNARMLVSHTGNIGINTLLPQEILHVNVANDSLQFENLAGTGSVLGIDGNGKVYRTDTTTNAFLLTDRDGDTKVQVEENPDDDHIRFDTRGGQRMVIDTVGRVGIGTNVLTSRLNVTDVASGLFVTARYNTIRGTQDINAQSLFSLLATNTIGSADRSQLMIGDQVGSANSRLGIGVNTAANYTYLRSAAYDINILPGTGAFVGLNTISPQEMFHVDAANDSLQFENLAGTGNLLGIDGNGKVFKINDIDTSAFSLVDTDGDTKVQVEESPDEDYIRFDTKGTERMFIDSTGSIKIGRTSSPAQALVHINNVNPIAKTPFLSGEGFTVNGAANNNIFTAGTWYEKPGVVGVGHQITVMDIPSISAFGSAGVVGLSARSTGGRSNVGVYGHGYFGSTMNGNPSNNAYGGYFTSRITSAVTDNEGTLYGVYANANSTAGNQIAGSLYGGHFSAVGEANNTVYGGYFSGIGGTTNYGVYSDSGINYFKENVGIGIVNPILKLEVEGNTGSSGVAEFSAKGSPNQINIVPSNADHAQIYIETNNGSRNAGITFRNTANSSTWGASTGANGNFYIRPVNAGSGLSNYGVFGISLANNYTKIGVGSINSANPNRRLHVADTSSATTGITPTLKLEMSSTSTVTNGLGTGIEFEIESDNNSNNDVVAGINAISTDVTFGAVEGVLAFTTLDEGDDNLQERMRIDHDGNVGIGTNNPSEKLHVDAAGDSLQIDNLSTGSLSNVLMHDPTTGKVVTSASSNITNSAVTTITTNLSASATNEVILVDASAGAVTVTLPTAIGNTGKKFRIKKIDGTANNMVLNTTGAETIDGVASQTTNLPYNGYVVVSDGANWFIIGRI